ncbi:MAG: hypothetical protein GX317_09790 [Staphylococcus equorum]|nr:hypothetical protein [Staphylococcus equorum]
MRKKECLSYLKGSNELIEELIKVITEGTEDPNDQPIQVVMEIYEELNQNLSRALSIMVLESIKVDD